jgi:DNA-binding response OmpR family regulator
MNRDDATVLEEVLRGLAEKVRSLLEDADLAIEILAARGRRDAEVPGPRGGVSDLLDDGRFAVRWNGHECLLGQTILFRLLRRLVASRNRYVSYEQLLDDVWGGIRSATAIRSAVRDLRRKLVASGMPDLAGAIDGANPGHYGIRIDEIHRQSGPHRDPTQSAR